LVEVFVGGVGARIVGHRHAADHQRQGRRRSSSRPSHRSHEGLLGLRKKAGRLKQAISIVNEPR
jgi:hypothetical protein